MQCLVIQWHRRISLFNTLSCHFNPVTRDKRDKWLRNQLNRPLFSQIFFFFETVVTRCEHFFNRMIVSCLIHKGMGSETEPNGIWKWIMTSRWGSREERKGRERKVQLNLFVVLRSLSLFPTFIPSCNLLFTVTLSSDLYTTIAYISLLFVTVEIWNMVQSSQVWHCFRFFNVELRVTAMRVDRDWSSSWTQGILLLSNLQPLAGESLEDTGERLAFQVL